MSRSHFVECLNATIPLTCTLEISILPAMRSVRRMIQCEGIVSLAMPCSYLGFFFCSILIK